MREEFSGGVGGARRWEEGGEDVWRREEQVGRGVYAGRGVRRACCTQGVVYARRGVRKACCTQGVLYAGRAVRRACCTQGVLYAGRGVRRAWCTQGVLYAGRAVRRAWCMINNPHLIECGCNGCETR